MKILVTVKHLRIWLMVAVVLLLGIQSTSYALMLGLSDGVTTQTLADNASGDLDNRLGVVVFSGSFAGWIVNVTTGISDPILGSKSSPNLDLNSVNVSSSGSNPLKIWLLDSGFTGPMPGSFNFQVGGTSVGSVVFNALYATGSTETFNQFTSFSSLAFSKSPFSGEKSGTLNNISPFSLGIMANITHTNSGATSFDANLSVVPVPPTVWLLGAGLVGLIGLRRRYKK